MRQNNSISEMAEVGGKRDQEEKEADQSRHELTAQTALELGDAKFVNY